ncbi:MAG: FmdE family protein [Wenzhouxiangella sp.]
MSCTLPQEMIDRTIAFHGHECPGLWIGVRVAELCLQEFGHNDQDPLTAVVEADMCAVDAIQFLTGCTYGKGNLIHRDYGKLAFSFYRPSDGKARRIVFNRSAIRASSGEGMAAVRSPENRARAQEKLRNLPLGELFTLTPLDTPAPRPARVLESLVCSCCGEATMETRTRRMHGEVFCIPCFQNLDQKL